MGVCIFQGHGFKVFLLGDQSSVYLDCVIYVWVILFYFDNGGCPGPAFAHIGLISIGPPTAVSHVYEWR